MSLNNPDRSILRRNCFSAQSSRSFSCSVISTIVLPGCEETETGTEQAPGSRLASVSLGADRATDPRWLLKANLFVRGCPFRGSPRRSGPSGRGVADLASRRLPCSPNRTGPALRPAAPVRKDCRRPGRRRSRPHAGLRLYPARRPSPVTDPRPPTNACSEPRQPRSIRHERPVRVCPAELREPQPLPLPPHQPAPLRLPHHPAREFRRPPQVLVQMIHPALLHRVRRALVLRQVDGEHSLRKLQPLPRPPAHRGHQPPLRREQEGRR